MFMFRMGKNLWGGTIIGEETPSLRKSRKCKQKVNFYVKFFLYKKLVFWYAM